MTESEAEVDRGRPVDPGEKTRWATEGLWGSELTMGTVTTGCGCRGGEGRMAQFGGRGEGTPWELITCGRIVCVCVIRVVEYVEFNV